MGTKRYDTGTGVQQAFYIHNNGDGTWSNEAITNVLLGQLLYEIRKLNSFWHCPNAIDIPHILRDIRRNTTKKKRKTK